MKRWKFLLSFMIVLIIMSSSISLANWNGNLMVSINTESKNVRKVPVVLDGQSVQPETPSFINDGNTFIPVRFLSERYGAKVDWDSKTQTVIINQSGKEIKMSINSNDVYINGKKKTLDSKLVPELVTFPKEYKLASAKTMVPLRFISETLGYEVGYDEKASVPFINTAKKEEKEEKENPRKVREISIENGNSNNAKVIINGTKNLTYSTVEVKNPNRLIIDIEDSDLDLKNGEEEMDVNGSLVNKVTVSQHSKNPDKVRVAIDLKEESDFDIISENGGKSICLSFVNKVKKISKEVVDGREAIVIYNKTNPETKIIKLNNPERIVVDLLASSLKSGDYEEYKYDIESIKGVRVSQFIPDKNYQSNDRVVRVVLDMKSDALKPDAKIETQGNKIVIIPETYKVQKKEKEKEDKNESIDKDRDEDKNQGPVIDEDIKPGPKLIVIDPGHGGRDPGAISKSKYKTKEKDVALAISKKLDDKLKALGYNTLMTRYDDSYPELADRAKLANTNNSDLFISIHANSFFSSSPKGVEVLYNPRKGSKDKNLASLIVNDLAKETGAVNRGIKDRPGLVVLNQTKMPSALVEVGFLSNPEEEKLIISDSYQNKMVEAMARAIGKYFQTN